MHPTTRAVWGDINRLLKPVVLQSPSGLLFSIAATGHVLYPSFTVTTSGTLSVTLHACWGQVGFTTQLWSLSFRFSGPLLGPTWLSPWCQKLCPHPFPPCPSHPPPIISPMRGACKSHIWNRCSNPTRRSGVYNYMHSHTCLVCRSCEKPCSSFFKNQNIHIISCHPTQGKHDHLPFARTDPSKIKYLNVFAST